MGSDGAQNRGCARGGSVKGLRIELMNAEGHVRVALFEGGEQDEANVRALEQAAIETGDYSWRTIYIRPDGMGAP